MLTKSGFKKYIKEFFRDIFVDFFLILILISYACFNNRDDILSVMGIVLAIISSIFWMISRIQLGASFSVKPEAKYMVTEGIYSKIKHPIYLFSSLAVLGSAMAIRNICLYLFCLLMTVVQITRARKEDALLKKTFKKDYENYSKKTWI